MFQSYDDRSHSSRSPARIRALRKLLQRQQLDGFLVPHGDEYQNEFIPPHAQRLAWITGFTGSAGSAVIMRERAAIFVDGRYILQVGGQVDTSLVSPVFVSRSSLVEWLAENLGKDERLGYDPRLHAVREMKRLRKAVQKADARLVPVEQNLIDLIWKDQPAAPLKGAQLHPLEFAGRTATLKIKAVAGQLRKAHEDAVILTAPESIAWMLNIRGSDTEHTPVVLCYAIVPAKGRPALFIDGRKISREVRTVIERDIDIVKPSELPAYIRAFGEQEKTVRIDPDRAAIWFDEMLRQSGASVSYGDDPCALPRAIKNSTEIKGMRAAHLRDGAAVIKCLAWLDDQQVGRVDEIAAAKKLEAFRRDTGKLMDISFDTISGAGPNGAIVHYRVNRASNTKLEAGSLYLVDSGGQYRDGTTDITRTVAIGTPGTEMISRNTLVLKGHIEIAMARFPAGTRGVDIDALARAALWAAGLDYNHGTGHGVGSYLSVHEGPQGISRRAMVALEPGMILSNEPGYYKEGAYGIRIENLVLVKRPAAIRGGEQKMLGFETLTLVPFDRRLIDADMLSRAQLAWLNDYHALVRKKLSPEMAGRELAWLEAATAPIG